ncbi:MAG: tRNA (guanosine(37)-N1)-methyltransferase TrmD [Bdellovibrionales bacterium]|nr:tRNA (guanosine(37)-N1)-methyltransferase TrmD [Bdellovibrionales bacterium]
MNYFIVTIMPELVAGGLHHGLIGQAFMKGLCNYQTINPRQFVGGVHQAIDDRPFGGGDGMVMMADPMQQALDSLGNLENSEVIYLSPQGEPFTDTMASEFSHKKNLVLFCGRYAGMDQRFLSKNKVREISIGDYVVSGGEVPALVMIDAITRKIPGVLGHEDSANKDSFALDGLLEAPAFTRPREWGGMAVPEVLLSGNHEKIIEFQRNISLLITLQKRPDLLKDKKLDKSQLKSFLSDLSDSDQKSCGIDSSLILKNLETLP